MPYRVLIVEDSRTQALRTQQQVGHEVLTAYDGKEGLQMALEETPELIITDINMPEMNGFELCRHLKSVPKTHDIPVLLLTAQDDLTDLTEGLEAGADGFIAKPFDAPQLHQRIEELMASSEQREAGPVHPNHLQILASILESYSSQSSSDVIGVLLMRQRDGELMLLLSILPLADELIQQFEQQLLQQLEHHTGVRIEATQIQRHIVVKETDLPPVTPPFSLFMDMPVTVRGRAIGVLVADSGEQMADGTWLMAKCHTP